MTGCAFQSADPISQVFFRTFEAGSARSLIESREWEPVSHGEYRTVSYCAVNATQLLCPQQTNFLHTIADFATRSSRLQRIEERRVSVKRRSPNPGRWSDLTVGLGSSALVVLTLSARLLSLAIQIDRNRTDDGCFERLAIHRASMRGCVGPVASTSRGIDGPLGRSPHSGVRE